jgi:hypothetical protein
LRYPETVERRWLKMGLFSKMKEKSRGVMTAAKPEDGVEPQSLQTVSDRLMDITGKGIGTRRDDDGTMVIFWSAKVAGVGLGGGEYEYLYRAISVKLDENEHEAVGICYKTSTEIELDAVGNFSASKSWERGQHVGSEKLTILAWLGPHQTEGGADETGYKFSWSDLRDPVLDAVTGAGWTYKPKKV